jgi:septum formation protein
MIYLASRSPRRRELLAQIGVKFEPLLFREGPRQDADTDEAVRRDEHADVYVERVTRLKVEAAWQRVVMRRGLQRKPVLAADTTVSLAGEILGKPVDRAAAFVERIEGSYSGVMGLPLHETAELLRKFGIVVP